MSSPSYVRSNLGVSNAVTSVWLKLLTLLFACTGEAQLTSQSAELMSKISKYCAPNSLGIIKVVV